MFNIWYPEVEHSNKLRFDVTKSEGQGLSLGTYEFITECLKKLDVEAQFSSWKIVPSRQNYFVDYLDSHDWKDRWPEMWSVMVNVSKPVQPMTLNLLPTKVEIADATYSELGKGFSTPRLVLVGAFSRKNGLDAEVQNATEVWRSSRQNRSPVALRWSEYQEGIVVLRGSIETTNLPADEGELLDLLYKWKLAGAVTSFQEALAKWA